MFTRTWNPVAGIVCPAYLFAVFAFAVSMRLFFKRVNEIDSKITGFPYPVKGFRV
jgi:hypothetical protein